jgi:cell fate (sporulation/competence/biofilm development) regulator YlbF (YheA/YmcA/DUF963 family)
MSKQQSTEEAIDEKLKAFLDTLEESETYQQFVEANERLENDEEAMALLEEFQQKQQQMQRSFDQSIMQELQELKAEMSENETIQKHQAAQQEFVELLQETDDAISEQIGKQFAQSTGGGCC